MPLACLAGAVLLAGCSDSIVRPESSIPTADPLLSVTAEGEWIELEPLPGEDDARAAAVNSLAQAVGSSGDFAVLWEDGEPVALEMLEGQTLGRASAINDAGRVAGQVNVDGGPPRAVIWDGGTITELGTLPGHDRAVVRGISNDGHVVGTSISGRSLEETGFLWHSGQMTALLPLPDDSDSRAISVNSSGTTVGVSRDATNDVQTYVMWTDGEASAIDRSLIHELYALIGITDAGDVIFTDDGGEEILVWRDGDLTVIPNPDEDAAWYAARGNSPGGLILIAFPSMEYGILDGGDFFPFTPPLSSCGGVSDEGHVVCNGAQEGRAVLGTVPLESSDHGIPESRAVSDLSVEGTTGSTVTLAWTQVEDPTGGPAWYRVKYAESPLEAWKNATIGCDRTIEGDEIGADISCTVESLAPGTSYDFQLMSYGIQDGVWNGAVYSNMATGTTSSSASANGVVDLSVVEATRHTLTARWTQVDDGTGQPAKYRVRYAEPPYDWRDAAKGCDATGDAIGAAVSCTFNVPDAETEYHLQLMSYRTVDGFWVDAVYSNITSGVTSAADAPGAVDDLDIVGATRTSLDVTWTQVDDGTGQPASYQLRYAAPLEDWEEATVGCDSTIVGDAVGEEMSCTIEGLQGGTPYDLQVASFPAGAPSTAGEYSNVTSAPTTGDAPSVDDLEIVSTTESTMTLRWTQVTDGADNPYTSTPAWYRVKYAATPLLDWKTATIGCDPTIVGDRVDAEITCTIEGLDSATEYDIQLMSFFVEDGVWQDARYSNLTTARTN